MWENEFVNIILIAIAAFRLTRVLVFDKIAEFIRAPFFEEVSVDGEVYYEPRSNGFRKWIGELLNCYWCTGVWVSAGLLAINHFFPEIGQPITMVFAVAGMASLIETINLKIMDE